MIWKQLKKKGEILSFLIKQGDVRFTLGLLGKKIYSQELAFGFKRDLSNDYSKRRALISINIRKYSHDDEIFFEDNMTTGLIEQMQTPYVATNKDGDPCFRCWMLDSSENGKLQEFWEGTFPILSSDEVLIENVFTVPKYRSMAVFPAALCELAEIYKEKGFKFAISFGETTNLNTTRSFAYTGFEPYILRIIKWRFFRKKIQFENIPDHLLEDYKKAIKGIPLLKK